MRLVCTVAIVVLLSVGLVGQAEKPDPGAQVGPTKDAMIELLQKKVAALETQAKQPPRPSPAEQLATLQKQLVTALARLPEQLGNPCPKGDSRLISVTVQTNQVSVGCLSPPKK